MSQSIATFFWLVAATLVTFSVVALLVQIHDEYQTQLRKEDENPRS